MSRHWGLPSGLLLLAAILVFLQTANAQVWLDSSQTFPVRAAALAAALTLDEKLSQLNSGAAAIPRLNIPAFNFWTGCAHGVAAFDSSGATIFPMPLALAATFDTQLMLEVATVFGDELRGKANAAAARGELAYTNCFDPNINIFRDPRWGRGAETFGEDPTLTSKMAAAFVRGVQWGNVTTGAPRLATESVGGILRATASSATSDRGFLKAGATCKHFAAYSLEEFEGTTRMGFNAVLDPRDVRDTYLPAFQACVQEGVASVMCAYNAVNGTPSCANEWLLSQTLRTDWRFDGFVVSDCDAIDALSIQQAFAPDPAAGAADALKAGTDLACKHFDPLSQALQQGLVTQKQITLAVTRVLIARLRQGHFDKDPAVNPYAAISDSVIGSPAHLAKAREAAAKSIVLLKNDPPQPGGNTPTLPLNIASLKNVTVIGPLANQSELLLGNYYGNPAGTLLSPWDALVARISAHNAAAGPAAGVGLNYMKGSEVIGGGADVDATAEACRYSDVCIYFLGASMIANDTRNAVRAGSYDVFAPATEGETWDRRDLLLPGQQLSLPQAAATRTNATVIVVLLHGGPLDVSWLQQSDRVGAILTAWFPGQGAEAIADVLFGDVSPSGRLPVTFYYNNYTDQISMADMHMRPYPGRTHRFLRVPVLYPFGHGLSYATFTHALAAQPGSKANSSAGGSGWLDVSINVTNVAGPAAEEAVLLFLSTSQPNGSQVQQGSGNGSNSSSDDVQPLLTLSAACVNAGSGNSSGDDADQPLQNLVGFDIVGPINAGQSRQLRFKVLASNFAAFASGWDGNGPPRCGRYWLRAGGVAVAVDVQNTNSAANSSGGGNASSNISTQSNSPAPTD